MKTRREVPSDRSAVLVLASVLVLVGSTVLGSGVWTSTASANTGGAVTSLHHAPALGAPDCSSSTPISAGPTPLSSSISDPSAPPQCFTFSDTSGDMLFVNTVATSTNPTPTYAIIDPNGNPVPQNGTTDANGTYTIEVSDTSSGPFNITMDQLDDLVGCTTIKFGSPTVTLDITEPGSFVCMSYRLSGIEWVETSFAEVPAKSVEKSYGPGGVGESGLSPGSRIGAIDASGAGVYTFFVFPNGSPATGPVTATVGDLGLGSGSGALSGIPGAPIQLLGDGFAGGERVTARYATGLADPAQIVLCAATAKGRQGQVQCDSYLPSKARGGAGTPHHLDARDQLGPLGEDLLRRRIWQVIPATTRGRRRGPVFVAAGSLVYVLRSAQRQEARGTRWPRRRRPGASERAPVGASRKAESAGNRTWLPVSRDVTGMRRTSRLVKRRSGLSFAPCPP